MVVSLSKYRGDDTLTPSMVARHIGSLFALALSLIALWSVTTGCGPNPAGHQSATQELRVSHLGPGTAQVRMIVEPAAGVRPLVRLLDRAQHTLFLQAYILTDQSVIHALERAAAERVDVRVMLEPHPLGLGSQPQRIAATLHAAGVLVRWTPRRFLLSHAKYVVIDDTVVVVSTANFSRSAFHANREFLAVLQVPQLVRPLSNLFRRDWDNFPDGQVVPNVVISPLDSRAKLTALIGTGRRTIDVYSEELRDAGIERALSRAERRGIRVRILVPASAILAARRFWPGRPLSVRGMATPYAHAKAIIVDTHRAFVGSENISSASLDKNREVGILIRGNAVRTLEQTFEADWSAQAP